MKLELVNCVAHPDATVATTAGIRFCPRCDAILGAASPDAKDLVAFATAMPAALTQASAYWPQFPLSDIPHGIKKDGRFRVVCHDGDGLLDGGVGYNEALHAARGPFALRDAEAIVRHMRSLGYRYVSHPPGLLAAGEMTIVRVE